MGFWSSLGKGLLGAGGVFAAPFTGGASLATVIPAITSGAGAVIGAMGEASAENRGEQDAMNLNRDQLAMQRSQLELQQAQDARTAETEAFRNAMRAALAQNAQDVSIDRSAFKTDVPTISFLGGSRPSAIGAEGRDTAAKMYELSRDRLDNPQALSLPEMSQASQAGFWEKLAGPVGLGLSAYGGMADEVQAAGAPPAPTAPRAPGVTLPPGLDPDLYTSPTASMRGGR